MMSSEFERIGRAFFMGSPLPNEKKFESICVAVRVLDALYLNVDATCNYVSKCIFQDRLLTCFFVQKPFELYVLNAITSRDFLHANTFSFIQEALRNGANRERCTCILLHTLTEALNTTLHAQMMIDLIWALTSPTAQDFFQSCSFMIKLLNRVHDDPSRWSVPVAELLQEKVDFGDKNQYHLSGFVDEFASMLIRGGTILWNMENVPSAHIVMHSKRFLERCAESSTFWAKYVEKNFLVEMDHTNWPPEMGKLVKNTLRTTSVHFVVHMARLAKLARFVEIAKVHSNANLSYSIFWTDVLQSLDHIWPSKVFGARANPSCTKFTCPISFECMIDPVVASDGNTYEREHILIYLCLSELSPLTRQPLELDLIPNRCVCD